MLQLKPQSLSHLLLYDELTLLQSVHIFIDLKNSDDARSIEYNI